MQWHFLSYISREELYRVSWALRGVVLWNASAHFQRCHRNHGCQPVCLLNASLDTAGVHEKSSPFTEPPSCNWPEPIPLQYKYITWSAFDDLNLYYQVAKGMQNLLQALMWKPLKWGDCRLEYEYSGLSVLSLETWSEPSRWESECLQACHLIPRSLSFSTCKVRMPGWSWQAV